MIVVGVDTGGTFTDCICWGPRGMTVVKLPSTPDNPAKAVLEGLSRLGISADRVVHGSTVATNALLERKGAVTAFVTNTGFEDLIAIGRQDRPILYDLTSRKPPCLVPDALRFGAPGRISSEGTVIEELDEAGARQVAERVAASGAVSAAVCLLFSFLRPEQELLLGKALADAGLVVSLSHEIVAEFREFERASTTVANAYVAPVMGDYLADLDAGIGEKTSLSIMQSSGGLITAAMARREPVRTILSGPAGGVVAALAVGQAAGFERLITFDMGGTSTDVSLLDRAPTLATEAEVAGITVHTPMLDIHTVGAGGGSLAVLDAGGALRVGPESAGADPGPACYGKGNALTVTDANLFLGRLAPDCFLGGQMPLYPDRLPPLFDALARQTGLSPVEVAEGIVTVAEATMDRAIRVISVERGHNPSDFALLSFGGAGGLHAVSLARLLDIRTVVVPRHPGLFSALGMLLADVVRDYSATVMLDSKKTEVVELAMLFAPMEAKAKADMAAEGVSPDRIVLERTLDMRYKGQAHELSVRFVADPFAAFHTRHEVVYGFSNENQVVEVVTLRLRVRGITDKPAYTPQVRLHPDVPEAAHAGERPCVWQGKQVLATWYDRAKLLVGNRFDGPAVVAETSATTFVPPGAAAKVDAFGNLVIEVGK